MPKAKPLFSIIIPSLNEAKYLPKLLGDLVAQTYQDFEVIVVDGHSDDQTVAKAQSFAQSLPHLTILTSPKRHVCVQRNLGAKKARADILIFMDADNRLPPYFLQGIKYRWESSNAQILSPYVEPDIKNPKNETITSAINLFLDLQMSIKPTYLLESMIIISRTLFSSIQGFDESTNYAEGKTIVQRAINLGVVPKIIKDPTYTFSLRRLRKYGTLGSVGRMVQLELAKFVGGSDFHNYQATKLYPMLGGTFFHTNKKAKNKFLQNITKLLKDF